MAHDAVIEGFRTDNHIDPEAADTLSRDFSELTQPLGAGALAELAEFAREILPAQESPFPAAASGQALESPFQSYVRRG